MENSKKKLLASFQVEKEGHYFIVSQFEDAIEVRAIKGTSWFKGLKEGLPDDDMEFICQELKNRAFDIIQKSLTELKIMAKGLSLLLMIDQETPKEEKELYGLRVENEKLKEEVAALKASMNNIVWVTVHVDSQRRVFNKGDTVVKFTVDKKKPKSFLLIKGVICAHGESNAETGQKWTYGNMTVGFGQTDGYANNSGYGRAVTTMAVIKNHEKTGPQELALTWNPNMLPFTLINPNVTDHAQYYDIQTQSVYTVWEIFE